MAFALWVGEMRFLGMRKLKYLRVPRRAVVLCEGQGKCFCDPTKSEDLRGRIIALTPYFKRRKRRKENEK